MNFTATEKLLADAKFPEPTCPDCHVLVDRPKCMFGSGSDCPRHEVRQGWHDAKSQFMRDLRSNEAGDVPMARARYD